MPTSSLTLALRPDSDALHRVVSVCRRRGLEIRSLSYIGDRVTLTIAGDEARRCRVGSWLASLVDVLEVSDAAAGGRP